MDVLMLGWEFPPHIAGGLGTACEGLTRALSRRGVRVTFLLPQPPEGEAPATQGAPSPAPTPQPETVAAIADSPAPPQALERTQPQTVAAIDAAPVKAQGPSEALARWIEPLRPPALPDGRHGGGPWEAATAGDEAGDETEAGAEAMEPGVQVVGGVRFVPIASTLSNPYARPGPGLDASIASARVTDSAGESGKVAKEPIDAPAELGEAATEEASSAEEPSAESDEIGAEVQAKGAEAGGAVTGPCPAVQREADFPPITVLGRADGSGAANGPYAGDVLAEARRYADRCLASAAAARFDVIHAHDWMTFPAGMAVAGRSGRPLVVHVHATEYDRSPQGPDARVLSIERRGMQAAVRVVCVSHFTRDMVIRRHGIEPGKVVVAHNGVELPESAARAMERCRIRGEDRVVLYLGRLTAQKGPEHFLHAAKLVLGREERVKFVIAGAGDESSRLVELAASLEIGHRVLFAGFLRGRDVERVFRMADVYVMPSVSEPFGLAPLEAAARGVPVIVSRQAGVGEVLTHALRADFWDTRELAGLILSVLRRPPLAVALREHAAVQVRAVTWDRCARRCRAVYRQALALMPR